MVRMKRERVGMLGDCRWRNGLGFSGSPDSAFFGSYSLDCLMMMMMMMMMQH